jgi:hypothetical protein
MTAFASVVRNPNSSCSPSTGLLLGPRTPCQRVQRPAKAEEGPVLIQREPGRRLARLGVGVFAERGRQDDAPASNAEPSPPVRAHHVADVRRWLAAVLWRSRHAPTGEDQLAATSLKRTIGANWSGKIPGNRAGCPCGHGLRKTNRGWLLGLGRTIEIAHRHRSWATREQPPAGHKRYSQGALPELAGQDELSGALQLMAA